MKFNSFLVGQPTNKKNIQSTSDILIFKITSIQNQNRDLRQDMVDIKLMLNKLLIDKHLKMEVDRYFEDHDTDSSSD